MLRYAKTLLLMMLIGMQCSIRVGCMQQEQSVDEDPNLQQAYEQMSARLSVKVDVFEGDNGTLLPRHIWPRQVDAQNSQGLLQSAVWDIDPFGSKEIFQGSVAVRGNKKMFRILADTGSSLTVRRCLLYNQAICD
jgi:hypothetical protein